MSHNALTQRIVPDRHTRVAELIVVLWLLSVCDLLFTLLAHEYTPFRELNPLAALLLRQDAVGALVAMKLSLTAVGSLIFWHLRAHARAEAALWSMVAVYVLLVVRWSDYWLLAVAAPVAA